MAEWWSADLLDARDYLKAPLATVRGGSLEWSIFRAVQATGSIELTRDESLPIDWLTDRIRIQHHDGDTVTPMGVYLPSVGSWNTRGALTSTTVSLSDKTELLNQPIGAYHTVPAGQSVVARVRTIIQAVGERAISVASSTATTRTAQTWEPTDTWLHVANELLASIGFGPLWVDEVGTWRAEPYLEPAARPVVASYGADAKALPMRPEWDDEADFSAIPNEIVFLTHGSDETPGLRAVARNEDPGHRFSIPARQGRVVRLVETGEAASQAVANQIAARRLTETSQITRRVTITHPLDGTHLNDVVTHEPLGMRGPIVQRAITMGLGAVVQDTIRHIHTGGDAPWQT